MLEDLLGFLMGALDEEELERLSRALDEDVALRRQVVVLRRALLPLELCDERIETPADLAARTWVVVRRSIVTVSGAVGTVNAPAPGGSG
jgi:hypothetical protein